MSGEIQKKQDAFDKIYQNILAHQTDTCGIPVVSQSET